jgi:DNA repair protein RecN (Recombination protein N)
MIDEVEVRDYALIAQAQISFAPGFTVLTGETGAGKTALVGAIKLLIGERADSTAIADGADEMRVSAILLDSDGTETIVARRLSRAGRSRASIDGELTTVADLAQTIGPRFDLLGQHEHQSLLSSASQLAYLDRFGGQPLGEALAAYTEAWRELQACAEELAGLDAAARQSSRELDDARYAIAAIEAVNPLAGELEQLQGELPILRRGEDLAYGADSAWQLMRGEGQALDLLAGAARALSGLGGVDARLDALIERLGSAQIDLEDIAGELVAYRDSVSFDAQALEAAQSRLGQLEGLARRFGLAIDDVLALGASARQQLAQADSLPELLEGAERRMAGCESSLAAAASRLGELRRDAATRLAERLSARLGDLAFSAAAIEADLTDLDRSAWSAASAQRFELLFKPQPNSVPRPLAKIASGGELSRVMLALKIELVADEGLTLVFDEVDAGIGGAAARAVAGYLRRLADIHQVIVVTHLAQIAAVADRQYVVEKVSRDSLDGAQATVIYEVAGEARVAELARMLSGSTDEAALAHARELLGGSLAG